MAEKEAYERFTMFDNWGKLFDGLPDEEAIKLFRAMYRYAFNNEEPDFEEGSMLSLVWIAVQPNIDASGKAAKGGLTSRPKTSSKSKSETTTQTTSKGGSRTPSRTPSNTNPETKRIGKGKEVGGEKEVNLNLPSEEDSNSHGATDGAAMAEATPPSAPEEEGDGSSVPVCPLCSKPVRLRAQPGGGIKWQCEMCGEIKEPRYEAV